MDWVCFMITAIFGAYTWIPPTSSAIDYLPNTCRSNISGLKHSPSYSMFESSDSEDPLKPFVCCNQQEFLLETSNDTCLQNLDNCDAGFATSFWLMEFGIEVDYRGSYFVSTGGQRSKSCGFYIRLDSVNGTSDSITGVFNVGVATTAYKWQLLFVAQLHMSMHLMVTWRADVGLDIYVDGQCAGTQNIGFPRDPIPACGSADQFPDFYVGRRNDKESGYCRAKIARLHVYLSWIKLIDDYDDEQEGATLAYYVGCIDKAAYSSLLYNVANKDSTASYTPATCRRSCRGAGKRFATILSNTDCYCLDMFSKTNKVNDAECNSICVNFTTATCGASGFLSVYLTSAFEYFKGPEVPISKLSVKLEGFDTFSLIYGQKATILFDVETGTNVNYFIYGTGLLDIVKTTETSAILVFPAPGIYQMKVVARNTANRERYYFTINVLDDIKAIKNLIILGSTGETNGTVTVRVDMEDGKDANCYMKFGDGDEQIYNNAETIDVVKHIYSSAGVYLVTMDCTAGFGSIRSNTTITILEKIKINMSSSFILPYGQDLVVPFFFTGSNISEVNVAFENKALDKICNMTWTCQSTITPEHYNSVGIHVLRVTATNILNTTISSLAEINIGSPISGFVVDFSRKQIFVNENLNVSINVSDGTQIYITLSIDGLTQLYICADAPCNYIITAAFPDAGLYKLNVKATNDFTANPAETNASLSVYDFIPALIHTVHNVTFVTEKVSIKLKIPSGDKWPNDAVVTFVVDDIVEESPFIQDEEGMFKYDWNPLDYGVFTLKVNISNPLQYTEWQDNFQVGKAIHGLSITVKDSLPMVNTDVEIMIGATAGNPITLFVDFGDEQNVTLSYELGTGRASNRVQIENTSFGTSLPHKYIDADTYTINISAFNVFGLTFVTKRIAINRKIEGIYLSINAPVTSPGSSVDIALDLERSANLPFNASCIFDFGDGITINDVKLTVTHTRNLLLNHAYTRPYGNLTINITCSNMVSVVEMSTDIMIIKPVTRCAISGPSHMITNKSAEFQISLQGSHLQLEILTSDGSIIKEEWQRDIGDFEIYSFYYTPSQPGVVTFSVKATNELGTCDSNITGNALNPIIKESVLVIVSPEIVDVSHPIVTITINILDGFIIPSEVQMFIEYGDSSTTNTTYPIPSEEGTLQHTYPRSGDFLISILLHNIVSEWETAHTVKVTKRVAELRVLHIVIQYIDSEDEWLEGHGPDKSWMPAGKTLKLFANTSLQNMHTTWSFSDDTDDVTANPVYHVYNNAGWYNVHVRLNNSSGTVLEEEYFDMYIVGKANSLSISTILTENLNEDVWMEKENTYILESETPTGPSCVAWDMGDSANTVIYGPPPCIKHALRDVIDFVEIDIQSPSPYQHRHTYDMPGFYKIKAVFENYVSMQNITAKAVVTVRGCSAPIKVEFQGSGQDVAHPREYERSETIHLDPTVSFQCIGIEKPDFIWTSKHILSSRHGKVYKMPFDIKPLQRPKRTFAPLTFNRGTYEIKLTVSVPGFPSYTGMDSFYIKVKQTPIVLVIRGGRSRAVGTAEPIVLDAVSESYDPDDLDNKADSWTFSWNCIRVSTSVIISSTISSPVSDRTLEIPRICDSERYETLDFKDGKLEFDSMMLRIGYLYAFRVTAYAGKRKSSAKQTLQILQGELPTVSIVCVTNCKGKMNPTSSFALQGSCANCQDKVKQYLIYKWTLHVQDTELASFTAINNLSAITSTGDERAGINVMPGVLQIGRQYRLRLMITQPDGSRGFSELVFRTNLPPYNGSCSVSPKFGYAITTKFNVQCLHWMDEGTNTVRSSTGNEVEIPYLQYRVLERPKGTTAYSMMYSGEDSNITNLLFGVGPEKFDHTFELKIQIIDKYGAKAETDLNVTVVETVLDSEDLSTLIGSNSSQLQQFVSAGDTGSATQLITAVLSVLNNQDTSGNSTDITEEEVKEIQSALLEELTEMSIWADTIEDLYSASSALSSATDGSAHARVLFKAAITMAKMAQKLESASDNSPEEVLHTAEGLTEALGNLVAQSEEIVSDAKSSLTEITLPTAAETDDVDEYADGAIDPELLGELEAEEQAKRAIELEGARFAAKTISSISQSTLNSVGDVLCGQQVSGQPPVIMDTGTIKAEFFVEEASKIAGRQISTSGGSFSLPSAEDLFPNNEGGNLRQKFYAFAINPFAWDDNSAGVGNEGTLSLHFESGVDEPVVVQNLTKEISIILGNSKTKLEPVELVFWNSTVHHWVNVADNDTDLRLIIRPDNSQAVQVLVKYGAKATLEEHDFAFEIPRNLTEDENWSDVDVLDEARYTVNVPSSNGSGAGLYYITMLWENTTLWDAFDDLGTADLPTAGWSTEYLPTVELKVYVTGCRYWNEEKGGWIAEGCRIGPLTNSQYTQCLCTHLSNFASSFFVPPNSIDFSTVFTKFKNLGDNAAVFSTVFTLFGVYLILLVWLRRKDKQDVIKWGVTPLADNNPNHHYYYQITVETGLRLGAGTNSKVGIIFSGDYLDTELRILDDSKREVHSRGSVCHFLMSVESDLGPLSYLKIWHDNSGEGDMAGWYLSKVCLLDIQTGERFYFICERWLAVEEDDGSIERLLPVASKSEMKQFSQLFYSGSREKLFDDHLWFSLFSRPTRSTFTRVQRLSCCLSLLYCSMIANAMFYRTEETVEKPTSLRIGPFIFTLQQFFVGFISALVVVPINIAIVQVFRKTKPSKKDSVNAGLPPEAQKKLDELMESSKKPLQKTANTDGSVAVIAGELKMTDTSNITTADEAANQEETAWYTAFDPHEEIEMIDSIELKCSPSSETLLASESLRQSQVDLTNVTPRMALSTSVSLSELEEQSNDKLNKMKFEQKVKDEFMLPHWCVFIGWFLFAVSCLVSAFFTILYSLEWGAEKSAEWLTSMLLSFFNSVIFIQPVKVLMIVTFLSLIFKKPLKPDADVGLEGVSLSDNQLYSDEELLHQPLGSANSYPLSRNLPSKAVLKEARKMRLKELRMYSILRETVIYSIYVMILLFLCYSNRDTLAFYVSKSVRDNFVKGHAGENTTLKLGSLSKSTPDLYWDWIEKSVLPGLYGDTYYNGEPMHWRHSRFLSDWQSYRVGPARLRQLRVKSDVCKAPKAMVSLFPHCRTEYSPDNEEEDSFSIGWKPPRNITYEIGKSPEYIPEDELMPWLYQGAMDLNGVPYPGQLALYGGGGFVAEFGVSMDRAFEIARFLRDSHWYDDLTKAIFLEFTVYNANTNLFSVAMILIELPTSGGGVVSQFVHTFRLYHYYGGLAIVSVFFQLLFVGYILYFTLKLVIKLRKEGRKELKTFWTFVELITLFLSYSAVGIFAVRQIFIYFSIKEVKNKNEGSFVNFAHIAKWDELFGYLMAFLAYLSILRYMRLLRLNPRMCLFGLTMQSAATEILCFSIMFGILSFAFSQMAYLLFSSTVYTFSTLITTSETLFAMMLGSFEFNPLVEANRIMGPFFFIIYILTMFFMLANMFITLISDAFAVVNEAMKNQTYTNDNDEVNDIEMVDFMISKFKRFLRNLSGSSKVRQTLEIEDEKPDQEATSVKPIELLDIRIDHLLDFVRRNYGEVDVPKCDPNSDDSNSFDGVASGTMDASPILESAPKPRS